MAIALDTTAQLVSTGTATPTISYTATGSDLTLICSVGLPNGTTVSGVTYNSVALTQLFTGTNTAGQRFYFFYLIAPSPGTHNLVVTLGGIDEADIVVGTYTGTNQSALDSSNSTTYAGGSTSQTVSTTVVASNCWLVGTRNGNRTSTPVSGTTDRQLTSTGNVFVILSDSNGTVGTGSQSLGWTSTAEPAGGANTPLFILSISPSGGTSNKGSFFPFMN